MLDKKVKPIKLLYVPSAGYLLGAGKPYYALALLGLIAPQVFFQVQYLLRATLFLHIQLYVTCQLLLLV